MFRKNLTAIALMLCITGVFGQEVRNCGTMTIDAQLKSEDPDYVMRRTQIENFTQEFAATESGATRTVITIPVVVHVVYNTAAENISDAAIFSQLDILNEDFRRLNADAASTPAYFEGIAADAEIEFCLASTDPSGNPTTGITRTSTTKTSFGTSGDPVKFGTYGHVAWDRDSYLNIWVCDLSSGLLGYAQFPGGPAATDGVVIDYKYFGGSAYATAPYDLGRSATHEVGHWLNLYHIWGDDGSSCAGSDLVADTPNQADETYGCPTGTRISCSNGPDGDNYQNYMDYTDDACMNMFTEGQKTRMQALFAPGGARESILTSAGCGGGGTPTCDVTSSTSTTGITETQATLNWSAVTGATAYNVRGRQIGAVTWAEGSTTGTSINFTGLTADTDYEWQVQTDCGGGDVSAYSASTLFTTAGGAATCTDIQEPNGSTGSAGTITPGVSYSALIASSGDRDYYAFTTTAPNTNIKVTLTSLPANYDVRILNQSGKKKAISQNSGTSDESAVWNTSSSGTRYIYVYGKAGAFDPLDCYDMLVEVSSSSWRTDGSQIMMEENLGNAIVRIYPNPTRDVLYVDYFSMEETDATISVFDMLGNRIQTMQNTVTTGDNRIDVNVDALASGLYFVEINNGTSAYTEIFMVE